MISRKLFLGLCVVVCLIQAQTVQAQAQFPIVLNEYSASNVNGPADNFGVLSDWVEIRNNQPEIINLSNYYLSNDRNNFSKWKFPAGYTIGPGQVKVIWLSGRGQNFGNNFHANFTLDQCKKQFLILSDGSGYFDSVFVQPTKAGHSRCRVDYVGRGVQYWRLYTTNSFLQQNPLINNYLDYTPKPALQPTSGAGTAIDTTAKTGLFLGEEPTILKVTIDGADYDTTLSNFYCYNVYYRLGGDYPRRSNWTRYYNVSASGIVISKTDIVRVITVPSGHYGTCDSTLYLPSFCETNTYFVGENDTKFNNKFGVVSIALDTLDQYWFDSQGVPSSTTIHAEYFDNKKAGSEGYSIINRPPHESWQSKQKGFYIGIDDRYGSGCNFEGPIFNVEELGTSKRQVFQTLHMKAGDHESASLLVGSSSPTTQGTALRDVLMQSIVAKNNINVSPLHVKPVRTYVNGKYWGVYNLTEVYDKFYENYYNGQPLEELDLAYYYNGDASVSYPDGSVSTFSNNFKGALYDPLIKNGGVSLSGAEYTKMMTQLDKASFIDYMILNSYAMNSDLWNFNVGFAKGSKPNLPGGKWHYYLWNMPAIFSYTGSATNTFFYFGAAVSPCFLTNTPFANYNVSPKAHNAHGKILSALFNSTKGNVSFQNEYKIRYQDLLNGPLKCENILRQLKLIDTVYKDQMQCHVDPACAGPGIFSTEAGNWDTNMIRLRKYINDRCSMMEKTFTTSACYGFAAPRLVTVNVSPAGTGKVQLNTLLLENFPWTGQYYSTRLSFAAISTATNYVFDHWEFSSTFKPLGSITSVSLSADFIERGDVVAVFTDITNPIANSGEGANIPNAFTPNDDGLNDLFRPLGSGKYVTEYQMTIWNRWGEEVYRGTDAKSGGWDGNYKGEKAITGVYAYIITYKDYNGSTKMTKGNVTLTR
jgi:gliding motility-associated-like protein